MNAPQNTPSHLPSQSWKIFTVMAVAFILGTQTIDPHSSLFAPEKVAHRPQSTPSKEPSYSELMRIIKTKEGELRCEKCGVCSKCSELYDLSFQALMKKEGDEEQQKNHLKEGIEKHRKSLKKIAEDKASSKAGSSSRPR